MMQQQPARLGFTKSFAKLLLFSLFLTPFPGNPFESVLEAQIQGKVFRDFNTNGVFDSTATFAEVGLSSVTVTAYNAAGTSVGSTTTNTTGNYTLPSVSGALRIEFSGLTTGDFPSAHGTSSGTSVQFVTAPSTTVNYGVNYPSDYCGSTNPQLATPCYINGDPLGGGTAAAGDVFVGFPFNATGTATPTNLYATGSQIGSTWGVAYQRSTKTLFTSAFLKRHVGLGSLGLGGIYKVDGTSTTPASVTFVDVATIGINVGTVASNTARGLPNDETQPSHDDANVFDQIGKVGMGDMDISEDEKKLFFTNLYDRKLYSLVIDSDNNSATAPTAADVQSFTIPNPGCTNGVARPFGIKIYKGKLYVGVVCTAENVGGTVNDMFAYIYAMDIATGVFNTTPVFSFPLNYPKLPVEAPDGGGWQSWTADYTQFAFTSEGSRDRVIRPQPILSDIAFDVDGSMILIFIDRTGHQYGYLNYSPDVNSTNLYNAEIGGDILRVANVNGSFQLENNGTAGALTGANVGNGGGPGTLSGSSYTAPYGEFYDDATVATVHNDCTQGGSALLPGSGQIAVCNMDPIQWTSGGIVTWSNKTGQQVNGYELYGSSAPNFGKANGLGDLEILCSTAPIEIGNRVWNDANKNGIQDAGETGIGNVTVELYPDFDNDGAPDVIAGSSTCVSNTTATGAAVACSGTTAWTNPANATAVDATAATAALATGTTSHCLQVTGLGLNIPSNATITGVTAIITRKASAASKVLDNTVQLLVGGVATGTNLATATTYTTAYTAATYGSSSNLWGTTLTPAQVNATNFGINFRAGRTGTGTTTASIDAIQISVCYTTPSGANSIATTTTANSGNIGTWYFNATNVTDGDPSVSGNQAGLAPNKKYLVRIGSADWTGGIGAGDLVNFTLTTSNATPVAGLVDVSDNDGVLSSTIPTIAYTTGSYGQNDHTLDFGFYVCTQPSAITLTKTIPTCAGTTSSNNGKITLTAISNADKYGISTGATYTGVAYASATTIAVPNIVQSNIPNTGGTYTIRFFNGSDLCYKDSTVTIYPITCTTCPKSTLYLCGLEKPTDAPYFDHGMITYLTAIGYTVQPAQPVAGGLQDPNTLAILVNGSGTPLTVNDFDKIIVSHSTKNELTANTGGIVTALTNTSKSVLMMTRTGTDVMGMAGSIGFVNSIGDLWIENNTTSILPSGLPNGTISVLNNPTLVSVDGFTKSLNYANSVGTGAIVGTYFVDQPSADTRIAYYGYPAGATLANGLAAAGRRFFIGFKIDGASASAYSPEIVVNDPTNFFTAYGKKLLDAAIENTCPCTCDTTLTVSNTTICNGSSVNLFSLASGVKGTLTYSTNGTTWTALTSPTNVTPSVTTTYYVKDTLTGGCFDIDTLVITVNPTPTTPSVSSPQMNVCPATTVNLTALAATLTPSVSGGVFEWHVSNSSGSALVSNQNAVVAGDYYLFERSPAGCYSTGLKVTVAIQVCCPTPVCIPVTITKSN